MNTSKSEMGEFPFLPALVLLGTFCLVVALLLAMQPKPPASEVAVAPTEAPTEIPPTQEPTTAPVAVAAVAYDPARVTDGQVLFSTICSACHGMDARGIPHLGKDLLASTFVHGLGDQELLQFVTTGRPSYDLANTTGVDMPARGGNPSLTDDQILSIIAYLRTETNNAGLAGSVASQPTTAVVVQNPTAISEATPTAAATMPPITAPSEDTVVNLPPVEPRDGASAYALLCAGCHGADGEGTPNNGPAINDSDLLVDDVALVDFLTHVERIAPVQGFVHPLRGGYPPLTNDEVLALTRYLHELTDAN